MCESTSWSWRILVFSEQADFQSDWNPEDRFDPLFAVLKEACGAALDPETEASRNEADLEEEEVEKTVLAELDYLISEAKTEEGQRFLQKERDMMAQSYGHTSRQRLID